MTTRRQVVAGLSVFALAGCGGGGGNVVTPTPTPSPTVPPPLPTRVVDMLAAKDGSVGQVYMAPTGLTGIQWYREALTSDRTRTVIAGATDATYTARAGDVGFRLVAHGKTADAEIDARALAVVLAPPLLLESFDSTTGFVAGNSALLSTETTGAVQGAARLVVQGTGSNAGGPFVAKADIGSHDPAEFGTVAQFFDLGWDPVYHTVTGIDLRFTRDGTVYESPASILAPVYQTPQPLFYGGMWASQHVSEIGALSTAGAGTLGVVNAFDAQSPFAPRVGVDVLLARAGGRPTIVLGFDDISATQYSVAFPYMRERGLKGGFHVVPDNVGTSGRMTRAQLAEMYAAGWDCYLNGSADDGPMTSKGTIAAAIAELQRVRDWAVAAEMPRGNAFLCYPNGSYQDSATRILVFSVTTDGSAVGTMNSTAGIVAGMAVGGYNVPAGTTVVRVDSPTQIMLSNPVPPQVKAYNFTDLSDPFAYTQLPLALQAAGFKMARTTQNRGGWLSRFGIATRGGILTPGNATSSLTLDELKAQIDQVILRGETIEYYLHAIADTGSVPTDPAKFTGLIDYIAQKRDAGLLDVLTKTELWARDGSAAVPV